MKNKTKESKVRLFMKDGKVKGAKTTKIQGTPVTTGPLPAPPTNNAIPPALPPNL